MGFERIATTASRIREALDNAGKRQVDVVRETGIDKGALSHYLKGRYEPKQDVIYKLAKCLDVSEMWLWGYDCPMERTVEQKNNDILSDIIVRLRTDEGFLSVSKKLYLIDSDKIAGIDKMLDALLK